MTTSKEPTNGQKFLALVITVLVGVFVYYKYNKSETPTKQEHPTITETTQSGNISQSNVTDENKLPENTYHVGDEIIVDAYTIKVTTFEVKPYYNAEFRPEEGNKLVAVGFLLNNKGNQALDYNSYEFRLLDENSYEYEPVMFGFKEPYLSGGHIQPGRLGRGWITFSVPKKTNKFEVKYTPGLFTGTTDYFIRLYK